METFVKHLTRFARGLWQMILVLLAVGIFVTWPRVFLVVIVLGAAYLLGLAEMED